MGGTVANGVITIHDGADNPIGSDRADQNGWWSFTPDRALNDGSHSLIAVDGDGQSSNVFVLNVDSSGPVPTISYAYDDAGTQQGFFESGQMIDDSRPMFIGGAAPGSVVVIHV